MAIYIDIKKKLEDFSIELRLEGSSGRIGILGASGCGKSMTLKMLAGIETPKEGRIRIGDRVLFDSVNRINIRHQQRKDGYLFQNYALFPTMTVEQNIAAGLRGRREEKQKKVREMVERFGLTGLEKRMPYELSGGQQQRTALARIMAYEPEVLLLDEPYGALDLFLRERLQQELLEMLRGYEGTVIMVSHDRDEIYRFSDELLVMEKGRTAIFGKCREIFDNPVKLEAARLTGCKNISKAKLLSPYQLEAVDFGIVLHTDRRIPQDTAYVGVHAHELVPVWGEGQKNCMKVQEKSITELHFERQYHLRPEHGTGESVCWSVKREKWTELKERGMPDYFKLPEERLLFLK